MKPLNPSNVIWLSGSAGEIDQFLKSEEVRDHAIILGHPDDAKRALIAAAQPGPAWEVNFKPLLGQDELEIVFLLMQGQVLGVIKQPNNGEVKQTCEGRIEGGRC
jgi:hypothetical protein